MASLDTLLAFFLAAAVLACVPGPGMVHAAVQTVAGGWRAGLGAATGFHLAGLAHVAAAAVGVSAVLALLPGLYTAIKLAGAAYLIGLGLGHLRAARPDPVGRRVLRPVTAPASARDGFVVEALNPQTALFTLAFLPQFVDPTAALPVWVQIAVLGVTVNALFSLTDVALIGFAHRVITRRAASATVIRTLRRVGGGALVGLGVGLALVRGP